MGSLLSPSVIHTVNIKSTALNANEVLPLLTWCIEIRLVRLWGGL